MITKNPYKTGDIMAISYLFHLLPVESSAFDDVVENVLPL